MLDWHSVVAQLKHVIEVHIVSVKNECKELLVVLGNHKKEEQDGKEQTIKIFCANDNDVFYYDENINYSQKCTLQQPIIDKNGVMDIW